MALPGAGPALSGNHAYVPMVNGMVLAYRLEPLTDPLKELGKINTEEHDRRREGGAGEGRRRKNAARTSASDRTTCRRWPASRRAGHWCQPR